MSGFIQLGGQPCVISKIRNPEDQTSLQPGNFLSNYVNGGCGSKEEALCICL